MEEKKNNLKIKGPIRIPTKKLRICTRKSPCGNGTNTYDQWEMRIHKRVFKIDVSQRILMDLLQSVKYDNEIKLVVEQDEEEEED